MVISMGANHSNFNPLELAFWSAMALNLMALQSFPLTPSKLLAFDTTEALKSRLRKSNKEIPSMATVS
jgi:hypothetical protein